MAQLQQSFELLGFASLDYDYDDNYDGQNTKPFRELVRVFAVNLEPRFDFGSGSSFYISHRIFRPLKFIWSVNWPAISLTFSHKQTERK